MFGQIGYRQFEKRRIVIPGSDHTVASVTHKGTEFGGVMVMIGNEIRTLSSTGGRKPATDRTRAALLRHRSIIVVLREQLALDSDLRPRKLKLRVPPVAILAPCVLSKVAQGLHCPMLVLRFAKRSFAEFHASAVHPCHILFRSNMSAKLGGEPAVRKALAPCRTHALPAVGDAPHGSSIPSGYRQPRCLASYPMWAASPVWPDLAQRPSAELALQPRGVVPTEAPRTVGCKSLLGGRLSVSTCGPLLGPLRSASGRELGGSHGGGLTDPLA